MRLMSIWQKLTPASRKKGHKACSYLRLGRLGQILVGPISPTCRRGTRHSLGPVSAHTSLYIGGIMVWFAQLQLLVRHISNTVAGDFCVEALNEAIRCFDAPGIMNAEQR